MKRVVLGSLLSCMLASQAFGSDMLITSVVPSLAGATLGGLYTLGKAGYAHKRYDTFQENTRYQNTLAHGGRYIWHDYVNPIAENIAGGAIAGALFGAIYGFCKSSFSDGCVIALASGLTAKVTMLAADKLHDKLDEIYMPTQGPSSTQFYLRPE